MCKTLGPKEMKEVKQISKSIKTWVNVSHITDSLVCIFADKRNSSHNKEIIEEGILEPYMRL